MDTTIPEPPKPLVIKQEDQRRLDEWIQFFKNLSPRIRLIVPSDSNFSAAVNTIHQFTRNLHRLEDNYDLLDWPDNSDICFMVCFNSSPPTCEPIYKGTDTYLFRFGDMAYCPTHFQWDGDPERDDWSATYSVMAHYTSSSVSWGYIAKLITNQIINLESLVPKLKIKHNRSRQ